MAMEMFTSNDLATLAATFARHYKTAHRGVFEPDTMIVQSMGMQRWLSMQIADYCGICANMHFLFPNNFFAEIINTLFEPQADALERCSRATFTWVLMRELPKLKNQKEFAFINSYLADDPLGLKQYQMAQKLADLYDQYALFRPQWVKSWQNADPAKLEKFAALTFSDNPELQKAYVWQALLWQRCLQPYAMDCQWPFLLEKLEGVLSDPVRAAKLPKEVFVFGISYLPPLYVDLFKSLSRRVNIYLFLLNPCAKYWGDAVSKYQERAIQKEFVDQYAHLSVEEITGLAHIEGGNRLLANWGGLGRQLLQKLWAMELSAQESFCPPGYNSMLHTLQSDILTMQNRRRPNPGLAADGVFAAAEPPLPFNAGDRSLQVHVCHSPLREIEVLHDNLLDMFDRDPALRPEDVIVIAPDINLYEPYINAVFLGRASGNTRLPFSVSDRLPIRQGLTSAFFMLLNINKTRFEADKVLALLETVRESFGIESQDLPQIERWLKEAGIRWGLSGAHKSGAVNIKDPENPVDYDENTWHYGLERLLLACAIPGAMQQNAFDGILSVPGINFDQKPLLGSLLNFIEALKYFHNEFMEPHTPQQWQSLLLRFLDTFFANDDWLAEKDQMQKTLQKMVTNSQLAGYEDELHLEAVRKYLQTVIENANFERGFLSQGITFCSAKPMRSIPFKVICFLGMDLESFPAKEHTASFDLIAQSRRRGDRSKRLDDRYLFLEALVSARDVFYVSYTGHNLADNSIIPPSVMLSELLEVAEDSFEPLPNLTPTEHIRTLHKMHAFDTAYFNDTEAQYFSYSRENFTIAKGGGAYNGFIDRLSPLSADESAVFAEITPRDFAAFFLNPAKAYAKKRLNINLEREDAEILNKEPFELEGLEGYAASREILDLLLQNASPETVMQHEKQSGRLPHGNLAPKVLNGLYGQLIPFAKRIKTLVKDRLKNARPFTENIDIYIGDLHIKGTLPVLCLPTGDYGSPVQLCFLSYSKDKPAHKLSAWLYHLLAAGAGLSKSMLFLDREQAFEFTAVENPEVLLNELAELYWQGLQTPLPFFPKTGLKYCRLLHTNDAKAESSCLSEWETNDFAYGGGECADSYVTMCFPEAEYGRDIPPDFYNVAPRVGSALFRHMLKVEEGDA